MKTVFFALLIIFIIVVPVYAEETEAVPELEELDEMLAEEDIHLYQFPKIPPELEVAPGFRFVDSHGSKSAEDYEYLENSVTLFGEARAFQFPYRFYFIFDALNKNDYFGEMRFTYSDMVSFRSVNRKLFHNTGSVTLFDLDTATPSPGVEVRDSGMEYGVETAMNNYFLRLKPHDTHAHGYIEYWMLKKNGSEQDVSLLGSGWYNDVVRTSQKSTVDWEITMYTIGANGHLGPLEADLSHMEKRFEPEGGKSLADFYSGNAFRAPGAFEHSLTPKLEGSSNKLKLHTSYTGKLVASATLSTNKRENTDSGATVDYFSGSGGLMWMPATKLTFLFRYSHREMDADNPGSVTVPDLSSPSTSYQYGVKKPISSSSDTILLCARYRLLDSLTLRGHYAYEDTSRDNAGLWDLRGNTNKQTLSLTARADLPKGADLRAEYGFTQYEDPAYNIEPDYSNFGAVSISWMPWPRLLALFSYNITLDKRDFLHYSDTEEARNLEAERNRELVSLTYIVNEGLSVTASYARMHDIKEQDIAYRSLGGTTLIDRGSEYEDSNQNLILALDYFSNKRLSLHSEISYTTSEATFSPSSQDLLKPVEVNSFSDSEVREVSFGASGEYELRPDLSVGLEYKYADMEEELNNPYDDIESGGAHFIMLSLSKKWR